MAKIASDWRKPDGLCTIHPDRALRFIDALPIEAFWGVGPATAKRFHEMGVTDARGLRALSLSTLTECFGSMGSIFYQFVRGIDDRPVRASRERKSVGCEQTLREDLRDRAAIDVLLGKVAEELMNRLMRTGFQGRTLTLKLRYADFTTKTRAISLDWPIRSADTLMAEGRRLLAAMEIPPAGIRLLGLTVSSPLADTEEPSLFD
ncbi:DNA polymerase IV [gut metagenome]|uniref:DNA-directed DNA polymerase n=1 Tax=gut metagenome TaxID=749906 RepID=J9GGM7_9ZZZZ